MRRRNKTPLFPTRQGTLLEAPGQAADWKTLAVLAGLSRQPSVGHFGPRRNEIGADQSFGDEYVDEEPKGV